MLRKTVAIIDLGAIKRNIDRIKSLVPTNTKYLMPVKANAYGHGIIDVAQYLQANALVDYLAVASVNEACDLRECGITLPILNFGLFLPNDDSVEAILKNSITQTIVNKEMALNLSEASISNKIKTKVHINIDTGMGRLGCSQEEAVDLAKYVYSLEGIELEGIYSHYPDAEVKDAEFAKKQIHSFIAIVEDLNKGGIKIPLKHMSNSAGAINYPEYSFDMIRPGILSYGYAQAECFKGIEGIEPAMTLSSYIHFKKRVPAGTSISYGMTHITKKETTIATIPLGYGDGYSRSLSNKGVVLIQNKEYPIVGRVTMDQIMVDIGNNDFDLGEEVILFGNNKITAATIADWIDTIPYEITCNISSRIPRIYINM